MSSSRLAVALVMLAGCSSVLCGDGTIERAGSCVPADETIGSGACGPGTKLQGDQCVPSVQCDPATTMPVVDPDTGETTCVALGTGCDLPIACPAPTGANKQTLCGQIFDLATLEAITDGTALRVDVFDAQQFVANPMTAPRLANAGVTIDDCGRFRVDDVEVPGTTALLGVGFEDKGSADDGPAGVTNAVGIGVAVATGTATTGIEGFIAPAATTTDAWASSGGPTVADGIFVELFRAHRTGLAPQAGVTVLKSGSEIHPDDFYFQAATPKLDTIDPAALATGANGAALIIGQSGLGYAGTGGLQQHCQWEPHIAASVPGVVFVHVTRPVDLGGQPCVQ